MRGFVGIADRLLDDSKAWLWIGGRMPDQGDRTPRNAALLERFEGRLPVVFEYAPVEELPAGEAAGAHQRPAREGIHADVLGQVRARPVEDGAQPSIITEYKAPFNGK